MPPSARLLRAFAKLRFRLLGLATIRDIPTAQFNTLLKDLVGTGWAKTGEYDGFDAWIDYGCVRLSRDGRKLKCEWDNWTEGSIEGPRRVIEEIGHLHGLPVTHAWRWSEWDDKK
jgi:hypothetical protein